MTDPVARLVATLPALTRNLDEAVLPFWFPRSVDPVHGGYHLAQLGLEGPFARRPFAQRQKTLVTQARMLWLFARLALMRPKALGLRQAAEHGYRFLVDHLRDPVHGGYVWAVNRSGNRVTDATKVTYGQAFALYALCGYHSSTGEPEALNHATHLFERIDRHSHDPVHGGYLEMFERDWSAPSPRRTSPIGGPPGAKLMNTHLHLLEAVTAYYRASGCSRAQRRLGELITIQSSAVVRDRIGACTDWYQPDWTPILQGAGGQVSYGHDLENIWLLADAVEAMGESSRNWIDLYGRMFNHAHRYGWDAKQGGFFYRGAINRPAFDRQKVWWVQAEALMSSLTLFRLTQSPRYAEVFEQTLHWVMERQTDWRRGEWHAEVRPDGSVRGAKANRWKEGYHNGRALIHSIDLINSLTASWDQPRQGGFTNHGSAHIPAESAHRRNVRGTDP